MEPELERFSEAEAVLITGPTASGKSSLALAVADRITNRARQPVIVNADSMQVYAGLHILTARPDTDEEALCRHVLYGHVNPAEAYSTGRWLRAVRDILDRLHDGSVPIFVGGTGLYFKALTEGFSAIPEIPDAVRTGVRQRLAKIGAESLHAELSKSDPQAGRTIRPGDSQRIVRAMEVLQATGQSIADWQSAGNTKPAIGGRRVQRLIVMPDRASLYQRIDLRFDEMIQRGAVDEVRAFLQRGLDPALPAMKAIGVSEIGGFLRSKHTLDDAVERSKQRTRQYAKRQMTWMRNQMADWPVWPAE